MTFSTINNTPADAHAFRVTLNIIMHSSTCPDDLAAVVERLRDDYNWDRNRLTKIELESVYAHLDSEICQQALSEWDAETLRMRDWGFPFWRNDYASWWDGENRAVDCKLCGHKHNRYEFPIVNAVNGNEIWTGSTCIVKYGVTVDGDGCAETALAKLRGIMGKSKTAQKRDAWEKEHPDAEATIDRIRAVMGVCSRKYMPWSLKNVVDEDGVRILTYTFERQRVAIRKWGKAAIKYFDKHGMLTPKRTDELWTATDAGWVDGMILEMVDAVATTIERVEENSPATNWSRFIAAHPRMNRYQRSQIEYLQRNSISRSQCYPSKLALIEEIEEQHKAPTAAKTEDEAAAKAAAKAADEDMPW